MAKKPSIRVHKLKARGRRRVQSLKVAPMSFGLVETLEQKNKSVVDKMAAFVAASK